MLTNMINGKRYVGQTLHEKHRLNVHKRLGHAKDKRYTLAVDFAIEKYGFENFKYEVLERDIPQDMLNEREIYWISFYDTMNTGYNLTKGGQSSIETCKKKVNMYSLEGQFIRTFDSITEASIFINAASLSQIPQCCKGKRKSAGGYQWRFTDDKTPVAKYQYKGPVRNFKKVDQYTLDGKYIKTYNSIAEAQRAIGRPKGVMISWYLLGKSNHPAYDFIWKYSDK